MSSPLSLVIFGASGDLTARKLIPALFSLHRKGRLPAEARIVGVARSAFTDDAFRQKLAAAVQPHFGRDWDQATWDAFAARLFYVAGDATTPGGLDALRAELKEREGAHGGRRLYYLSVAPELYAPIVAGLGAAGMADEADGWRRVVIEKPFGRDRASAEELNRAVRAVFREKQIYRIDHYLGKETVQNVLVFRFANSLFEPLWNHKYIDSVQITVSETVTMEGGRGGYYDRSGVLRDMFQNHLLQVLALVAMEPPARYTADQLRNEKLKVLESVAVSDGNGSCGPIATGQYAGYRAEKGVAVDSRTPTFAALKLQIDNWRWQGVPFYLRSGKAMSRRLSEVVVQFLRPPHLMFPLPAGERTHGNRLSLCLQPDEGIHVRFQMKVPDTDGVALAPADLEFHYNKAYPRTPIPEAYEILLLDALQGDAHLFMRSDEIERAWEIVDPLIAAAENAAALPEEYAVGADGPACADRLLRADGRAWQSLCVH